MSDFDLSRLDAAFADMRSETAPFVSSPGFAAAQTTARRRNRVRAAALTGLAAALIVVPVAAYATWNQDRAKPPVLAPTPTPAATATTPAPSSTPSPTAQTSEQPVTPANGKSSPTRGRLIDEPLGYTPIWVEGAISGLTSYIPANDSNTVSIGVKVMANKGVTTAGPAHNVKLTVDLSAVTGSIEITAVSGPCTFAGSIVRCTFGTLPIGEHRVQLTLRARPEASAGRVGQVSLEVTGDELSWHTKECYGWVEIKD